MFVVFRSCDQQVAVSKMREVQYQSSLLDVRMAATPDSPVSRPISYELRETSLLNGNANGNGNGNVAAPRLMIDKAVQFEANMDLNNLTDFNGGDTVNSYTPTSRESEITPEWSSTGLNETIPVHVKITPTDDAIKAWRRETETVTSSSATDAQQKPPQQQPITDDGPRYKINQPEPATPDGESQTNTSTWRIRDHNRNSSGSEDEIEKISELIFDVEAGEKGKQGRGDNTSNQDTEPIRAPSTKPDGQRRDDDDDSDCVVQCLSYTLQCCECVIS